MKGGVNMLEQLRERASEVMAKAKTVTLATCGPADIQSEVLPCRMLKLSLYLLVPSTSDQLLNIEHRAVVLVTGDDWQLRGRGRILTETEVPDALLAERMPDASWSIWVAVTPQRLTLFDAIKKSFETFDFIITGGNNVEVL